MIDLDFDEEQAKELLVMFTITFVIAVILIKLWLKFFGVMNGYIIAAEIFLYGTLFVYSAFYLITDLENTPNRMVAPGALSLIVFVGCIIYALISGENTSLSHFAGVGLVLALVLLGKGLIGPLALATTLILTAYGLLHNDDSHIPLISALIVFIFGEINITMQYVCSGLVAILSISNVFISGEIDIF